MTSATGRAVVAEGEVCPNFLVLRNGPVTRSMVRGRIR